MDLINPLAGAFLQGPAAQRFQVVEKQRQARLSQAMEKDIATRDDEMEHQVESAEELAALHEDKSGDQPSQQKKHGHADESAEEESQHVDITA